MKQSHLAELMGVTQATVSRWESDLLALSAAQRQAVQDLLRRPPDPAQDAALKRLVDSSALKLHLICDQTHRLLASSLPRRAEWHADQSAFLGKSLFPYASPEIQAAEAMLEALGWQDGGIDSLVVDTGGNGDAVLPILPGRVLWERIALADGMPARLVTTLA